MGLVKVVAGVLGIGGGGLAVAFKEYGLAESHDTLRRDAEPRRTLDYPSQSESAALLDAALSKDRTTTVSPP